MKLILKLESKYRITQNEYGYFLQEKKERRCWRSRKNKAAWGTRGLFSTLEEAIKAVSILEAGRVIPDVERPS